MGSKEESAQNKQQMKSDVTVKTQWSLPKYLPVGRTTLASGWTTTLLTSGENRFVEVSCFCSCSRGGWVFHLILKNPNMSAMFGRYLPPISCQWDLSVCANINCCGDFVQEVCLYANTAMINVFVILCLISWFTQKWHGWVQQKQLKSCFVSEYAALVIVLFFVYLKPVTSSPVPRISFLAIMP